MDNRPAVPGRLAHPRLEDLTGQDLEDYERHICEHFRNPGARENARSGVQLLWRYRTGLTDCLRFNPRYVEGFGNAGVRPRENATDRIPEDVLGPLVTWSMRFVDSFAPDIMTADARWHEYRDQTRHRNRRGRNSGVAESLTTYLDSLIERGEPLPGHRGLPNWQFICAAAGVGRKTLQRRPYQELIDAAASKVGITEYTWLLTNPTATLDGLPWVNAIAVRHPNQSLDRLARLLQVSCYVLIAFFSGMRDSEIKHLTRGCLTSQQDPHGRVYRWKVTSLAFKGEHNPAGTEATWVIGEPAARAITVLEKLQPPEESLLFAHLPHSVAPGPQGGAANRAVTTRSTNSQMAELMQWINTYCTAHGRSDGFPTTNGTVPALTTSRFRRTLAWFIARQPGGSIAGAIQYRHLSIQMFEGYCGTSDSGFRAEVESEQALARGEYLTQMIESHEHTDLRGPAADTARHRLQQWGSQFGGAVVTDRHQLKRLMQRADPAIYPGTFAMCVFDPNKALCSQQRDAAGRTQPTTTSCQPLDCGNVALTEHNITALHAERGRIEHELARRPSLPPLLNHRLQDRRERILQFLGRQSSETT
ncbi:MULTISPECIES: hypothetical protein [unclassified Mycolicibacterium]|uniref:hypothetical protein n=1 Tax=unclassified Mycolicibacterium TaxID=2636767 RepID=UPI002ED9A171